MPAQRLELLGQSEKTPLIHQTAPCCRSRANESHSGKSRQVDAGIQLGITSGQLKTWHLELLAAGSATAIAQTKAEATELAQLRRDNSKRNADHLLPFLT